MKTAEVIDTYFKTEQAALKSVIGINALSKQVTGTFFLRNELRELTTEESLRKIMTAVDDIISTGSKILLKIFTPTFYIETIEDSVVVSICCPSNQVIDKLKLGAFKNVVQGSYLACENTL
jgi:hypothetical protein